MNNFLDSRLPSPAADSVMNYRILSSGILESSSTNKDVSSGAFYYSSPMPMDTIPSWSLQSIFSSSNTSKLISNGLSNGLSSCEKERLQDFVEPILEGLRALDPEELLQLQRINAGGATLRDGYVGF